MASRCVATGCLTFAYESHLRRVAFFLASRKGGIERELALCENLMCAIAAFDAAVREFPNGTLTLRQGIRVLREHPPRNPSEPGAARPVSLHVVRVKRE